MSAPPLQIVVGFDFSNPSRAALARALQLAESAPLHVLQIVCAIDPHSPFPSLPAREVDADYVHRVEAAIWDIVTFKLQRYDVRTPVHVFVHAVIGKPVANILAVARDVGADLILVGTHGLTGVERMLVGSVGERIAREAGCTVEIVREKTYPGAPLPDATGIAS